MHAVGEEDHRRQFNGKENDPVSGLRYYGFRYYDPVSLRWTSADPMYRYLPDIGLSEPQRLNLYSFSLNNPVRYYDADGRDANDADDERTDPGECKPPEPGECKEDSKDDSSEEPEKEASDTSCDSDNASCVESPNDGDKASTTPPPPPPSGPPAKKAGVVKKAKDYVARKLRRILDGTLQPLYPVITVEDGRTVSKTQKADMEDKVKRPQGKAMDKPDFPDNSQSSAHKSGKPEFRLQAPPMGLFIENLIRVYFDPQPLVPIPPKRPEPN